jgi:hypothetical protein
MSRPKCTAKTKKGKPCRATPRQDTGLCNAHSPKEVQESAGFGGPQPGAGRPRTPRPSEIARQIVERNQVVLLRPYFRTLGYELHDDWTLTPLEGGGAIKYVWAGPDAPAVAMLDLGAQMEAAEKLQNRIYGRPRQQLEHTGEGGGPVEHTVDGLGPRIDLTDPEQRKAFHDLLGEPEAEDREE